MNLKNIFSYVSNFIPQWLKDLNFSNLYYKNQNLIKNGLITITSFLYTYIIITKLLEMYYNENLNYYLSNYLTIILDYFKFSKEDYEYDFNYILNFLKENSPYANRINFDEIKKQKDKVCNCKNRFDFEKKNIIY